MKRGLQQPAFCTGAVTAPVLYNQCPDEEGM
jgi:hypothetical protein